MCSNVSKIMSCSSLLNVNTKSCSGVLAGLLQSREHMNSDGKGLHLFKSN
jgi:hypothetical protein